MKTFFNLLATTMVFFGLAMMAQSNTMMEMLTLAGLGLAFFVCGGAILVSNSKEAV